MVFKFNQRKSPHRRQPPSCFLTRCRGRPTVIPRTWRQCRWLRWWPPFSWCRTGAWRCCAPARHRCSRCDVPPHGIGANLEWSIGNWLKTHKPSHSTTTYLRNHDYSFNCQYKLWHLLIVTSMIFCNISRNLGKMKGRQDIRRVSAGYQPSRLQVLGSVILLYKIRLGLVRYVNED